MTREDVLKEMILEYRKKVETYQNMIEEWEREIGVPSSSSAAVMRTSDKKANAGFADVEPWQFLGKSQPEATKALLAAVGHPLTTEQIMEGIRKGGVEVGGNKYTFYTILNRMDDVTRFRKNTWGLTEWPGAQRQKANTGKTTKVGKEARKRATSKAVRRKSSKLSVADLAEQVIKKQGNNMKASAILNTLVEQGHAITQAVLASALQRGLSKGRFIRPEPGVYGLSS